MALTDEQVARLIQQVAPTVGLSLRAADRLAAFAEGLETGIRAVAPLVTLVRPKRQMPPSEGKADGD